MFWVVCIAMGFPVAEKVPERIPLPKALEKDVIDITGYYSCKGMRMDGKKYSGVTIIAKRDDVYTVTWLTGGDSSFTGVGIRHGNKLSCGWVIPGEKGFTRGISVFRIEQGPRLSGTWSTLPGPGKEHEETLTFIKNLEQEER